MKRTAIMFAVLGCNARAQPLGSDGGSSSTSGDATTPTSTSFPWPLPPSDDGASYGIIDEPDFGSVGTRCDLWSQDCPPGSKCMGYANDGGGAWNAARCTPVADDPKEIGEPCSVVDSPASGIDDCERGAMCWFIDPETNVGECVGLCRGSEANPFCDDPCAHCTIAGEGVIIPCLRDCDPIAQSCPEGQACYPVVDAFVCAADVSDEAGGAGESCEFINVCDPGLLCVNPEYVPGCEGPSCCTSFCDVDATDECDAILPGTVCTPWFETAAGPQSCLGTGTIGFCAVPR